MEGSFVRSKTTSLPDWQNGTDRFLFANGLSQEFPETLAYLQEMIRVLDQPYHLLVIGDVSLQNGDSPAGAFERIGTIERLSLEPDISFPLPWADDSFDIVIAIDALDLLAEDQRSLFLNEIGRVCKHAFLITQIRQNKGIEEVHDLLADLYYQRYKQFHPSLTDQTASCNTTWIKNQLSASESACKICYDTPFLTWIQAQLFRDHYKSIEENGERFASGLAEVISLSTRESADNIKRLNSFHYRKLFIAVKTFKMSFVLDTPTNPEPEQSDFPQLNREIMNLFTHILTANENALTKTIKEQQEMILQLRRLWESSQKVWSQGTLSSSGAKGHPLLTLEDLLPEAELNSLSETMANAWRSKSAQSRFTIPCRMHKGWIQIILHLRKLDRNLNDRDTLSISVTTAVSGKEITLEKILWQDRLVDSLYIFIPEAIRSLHIYPLQNPQAFVIEEFSLKSLNKLQALRTAITRKWRLLRAYRCTFRVLFRGSLMIFTGRWQKAFKKIFKGLPDSRLMRPENDVSTSALASIWHQRGLSEADLSQIRGEIEKFSYKPEVAILLMIHHESPDHIRLMIESVRAQVYARWNLFIGMTAPEHVLGIHLLERYAATDDRIRVFVGPRKRDFSTLLNLLLKNIPQADIVVLNSGYELSEIALYRLVQEKGNHPQVDILINDHPSAISSDDAARAEAATFRRKSPGQLLHWFSKSLLVRIPDLLDLNEKNPYPGSAILKSLLALPSKKHYIPDQLTYPSTTIAPVQLSFAQKIGQQKPSETVSIFAATEPMRSLLITGNILGISGWDTVVYELVRGLHSLGIDVRLNQKSRYRADLVPPHLISLIRQQQQNDLELVICPPHLLQHHRPQGQFIWFTMWESDRLDPSWLDWINKAKLIIVPSNWNREGFLASGVTVPIDIVPLGYDPLQYYPNREWPAICTFGTAGALWAGGIRKNTKMLIDLFQECFPNENDVRLRVKITPRCDLIDCQDPRIEILRCFMTPDDLANWYRSLSAYVNTSSSEGFGLHLIEAMASGKPLISTIYSGMGEFFDGNQGINIPYHIQPTGTDIYPGCWAVPDRQALKNALRTIYEHPEQAKEWGDRASIRAKNFTWKNAGHRLIQILRPYLLVDPLNAKHDPHSYGLREDANAINSLGLTSSRVVEAGGPRI